MAPASILLDRYVRLIIDDEAAATAAEIRGANKNRAAAAAIGGASTAREIALIRRASKIGVYPIKPDPHVADPPEVSSFSLLLSTPAAKTEELGGSCIASTDKNLAVLYAGDYRPGSSSRGCYLIYDAMDNSLSMIPPIPCSDSFVGIGCGVAILRHGKDGDYVLAELVARAYYTLPDATLWLWWSSAGTPGQWVQKEVSLPPEVSTPTYYFSYDTVFSFGGSYLCWVDLLIGIVIWDVLSEHGSDPEFRFIPLPEGCSIHIPDYHRFSPEEFRYMGCVGSAIKFVTMDNYLEGCPGNEVTLTTWTLMPDLWEWKKGVTFCYGDLWANETFRSMGLPQCKPTNPVLSMHEDDIVYVFLSDVEFVGGLVENRGQYVLGLDMRHNKVQSFTKCPPGSIVLLMPCLFASDFSAYLQASKDHQTPLISAREGKKQAKEKQVESG